MIYPLACSSWGSNEKESAKKVIDSCQCTMGLITRQLEDMFANYFGSKYCIMSNSGSSANLLAISALMYRKNGLNLKKGDTVLVPTVSWSTTYYPLYQNGLKMKFIDIDKNTLNISIDEIKKNLTPDVKAIFAVNLLGNSCDFEELQNICSENNIILIEDNCESMGSKYKDSYCGTIGLLGTYSSFFSHHICSVEGGFTVTNDKELYEIMISLRAHGWTRGLPEDNSISKKEDNPFNDLFKFVLPGYNLRPNDIFAAIGIEQLKKLPFITDQRIKNANYFFDKVKNLPIRTQVEQINTKASWFGFAIILEGSLTHKRNEFVKYLFDNGVECRPIVAGNFTKNPVIKYLDCEFTSDCVAKEIDENGLFIGNSHSDLTNEINYFVELTNKFVKI